MSPSEALVSKPFKTQSVHSQQMTRMMVKMVTDNDHDHIDDDKGSGGGNLSLHIDNDHNKFYQKGHQNYCTSLI